MATSDRLPRHWWAWLSPGWPGGLRTRLPTGDQALIEDWRLKGHPLIVASASASDRPHDMRLGLATPGKRRIGVHLDRDLIARVAAPPSLRDALNSAPCRWRPRLIELSSAAEAVRIGVAVYGSLAWDHWSNAGFVGPTSDVDLLVSPGLAALDAVLGFLARLDALPGDPRLDGELVLPTGNGVAWREFIAREGALLIKGHGGPALTSRAVIESQVLRTAS